MRRGHSRESQQRLYWRTNSRLIACLLSVWAFVSLGCGILLVQPLNQFRLGKLPLGFWFAQQGSIYIFVVLVFAYAWSMDRLDRRYEDSPSTDKPDAREK